MSAVGLPPADPQPRVRYDAVLLVSFGGPEGQDDVLPFLRNVTRGRGIPDERLEEVAHHYRHFGGVSPINEQCRALRAALGDELARRGLDLPVYWGNRNWDPYLADALREAHAAGHRRLLAVVTSAYSSYSSCRQYREDLAAALAETGLTGELEVDKVRQYFDHPGFVAPFVTGTRDAVQAVLAELGAGARASDVHVLFATHSIPTPTALASGPPGADLGPEGAYGAQHRAVAEVVMASLASGDLGVEAPWSLVYQSRSGSRAQPVARAGRERRDPRARRAGGPRRGDRARSGSCRDHMEVLWDLDEEATQTAHEAGLAVARVPTPGVDPAFVAGLVDLVAERHTTGEGGDGAAGGPMERPALTPLGPWYDVCRAGCCANPRGERPGGWRGCRPATRERAA